jgi:uncharacterized protein (TIGR02594 family)
MRSRLGMALALACIGALFATPVSARPIAKSHQQTQAKQKSATRQPRDLFASVRLNPIPALVAEARKYIGTNPTDRKRLWCTRFMNFVLAKLGYAGTDSDAAKSFAYYGRRIPAPQVGAIAVLSRGRNGGHVGVVSGVDAKGDPIIISGNHSRTGVGEGVYARARVIAYVLPTEHRAAAAAGNTSRAPAMPDLDSPITELLAAIQAEAPKTPRVEAKPAAPRQAVVRVAPRQAVAAPARHQAVAPAVAHRMVQQTPDAAAQAGPGDPFSELIGAMERAPAPPRRVL